jgi:hypothetical protein
MAFLKDRGVGARWQHANMVSLLARSHDVVAQLAHAFGRPWRGGPFVVHAHDAARAEAER